MKTVLEAIRHVASIGYDDAYDNLVVVTGSQQISLTDAEERAVRAIRYALDRALAIAIVEARRAGIVAPLTDDLETIQGRLEGFVAEEFARLAGRQHHHPTHIDQARTFVAEYEPEPLPLPPAKLAAVRNACDHILLHVEAA